MSITDVIVPTEGQQDDRRRRARRIMAYGSWAFLIAQAALFSSAVVFSDHRVEIVSSIAGATPLLIATDTMLTSIVLGYFGVSMTEAIKKT